MSSNKKKSEFRTKLPDGSSVRENREEETHPDGTKTTITTTVKLYTKVTPREDGSQLMEDIETTTTTRTEQVRLDDDRDEEDESYYVDGY